MPVGCSIGGGNRKTLIGCLRAIYQTTLLTGVLHFVSVVLSSVVKATGVFLEQKARSPYIYRYPSKVGYFERDQLLRRNYRVFLKL